MSNQLTGFLNNQHFLGKQTKDTYVFAIKKYEENSKKSFEETYLDSIQVHKVLSKMENLVSPSSWNTYLQKYKRYAKYLYDSDDEVCPKVWRKIKLKKIDWEKKLKHKWLTEKQFYMLLDVVDNPRDKAMFGVAVEGALRAGELIGLKIRDAQKTSYGYDVTVSGKTGSSSFPVVLFAPLLTHWLNHHPYKHDPNSFLWLRRITGNSRTNRKETHDPLLSGGVLVALRKYCKRAGLPVISLHWLRHSKITWTAKNSKVRISDEMAKKMFRWSKTSNMFSRYTHLHGTDSKESFLALAGIETKQTEENNEKVLEVKNCLNCNEKNSAVSLYCLKCGSILDSEEAKRIVAKQKLMDEMLKDFQERMLYQEKLKKLEASGVDKKVLEEQKNLVKTVNKLKDYKTKLDIELLNEKKKRKKE